MNDFPSLDEFSVTEYGDIHMVDPRIVNVLQVAGKAHIEYCYENDDMLCSIDSNPSDGMWRWMLIQRRPFIYMDDGNLGGTDSLLAAYEEAKQAYQEHRELMDGLRHRVNGDVVVQLSEDVTPAPAVVPAGELPSYGSYGTGQETVPMDVGLASHDFDSPYGYDNPYDYGHSNDSVSTHGSGGYDDGIYGGGSYHSGGYQSNRHTGRDAYEDYEDYADYEVTPVVPKSQDATQPMPQALPPHGHEAEHDVGSYDPQGVVTYGNKQPDYGHQQVDYVEQTPLAAFDDFDDMLDKFFSQDPYDMPVSHQEHANVDFGDGAGADEPAFDMDMDEFLGLTDSGSGNGGGRHSRVDDAFNQLIENGFNQANARLGRDLRGDPE